MKTNAKTLPSLDYIALIIVILAFHLLFVNTEIITKLLKIINNLPHLTALQTTGAILFAFSYSLITVLIIKVYPNPLIFILTALFDGFAVYLNYSQASFFAFAAAVYLGLYTTLIIIATGFIEKKEAKNKQKQIKNKTEQTQKQIAIKQLQEQKKRIQLAINRTKDPNKLKEKQNKLKEIENKLNQLQNKQKQILTTGLD